MFVRRENVRLLRVRGKRGLWLQGCIHLFVSLRLLLLEKKRFVLEARERDRLVRGLIIKVPHSFNTTNTAAMYHCTPTEVKGGGMAAGSHPHFC